MESFLFPYLSKNALVINLFAPSAAAMPPDRHIVYVAYLRAYARGTGWFGMGLHFGIAASGGATCPRCDGASADHKPGLLHRDGVGVCITGFKVRVDGFAVGIGLSVDDNFHIQSLVSEVLRQQDEGIGACGCGIRVFATPSVTLNVPSCISPPRLNEQPKISSGSNPSVSDV